MLEDRFWIRDAARWAERSSRRVSRILTVALYHTPITTFKTAAHQAGMALVPRTLLIEALNTCNANCVFCAYQHDRRPKRVIRVDWFKKAVDEYKEAGGSCVGLTPAAGELFIDKNALAKIGYVHRKGFSRIHTYTNATLLHRVGVDRILESGLTKILISVAPLDPGIYATIYRNRNYRAVIRNIKDLLVAFERNSRRTVVSIGIEFRADRSLDRCKELPDYKQYVEPFLSAGVTVCGMREFDSWDGQILQSDLPEGMLLLDPDKRRFRRIPCTGLFDLQVASGGDIRLCGCRINTATANDSLKVGHIGETSIVEAFNSPRARSLMRGFLVGKPPALCQTCSFYSRNW